MALILLMWLLFIVFVVVILEAASNKHYYVSCVEQTKKYPNGGTNWERINKQWELHSNNWHHTWQTEKELNRNTACSMALWVQKQLLKEREKRKNNPHTQQNTHIKQETQINRWWKLSLWYNHTQFEVKLDYTFARKQLTKAKHDWSYFSMTQFVDNTYLIMTGPAFLWSNLSYT